MVVTGHTSFGGQTAPSPGQHRPASIRDVAQAAGVSYQTVSRVINGRPNVKEETRGRVEAAVRALGFRRNATAFALASGVTRAVTVLTSNTVLHGYAATLQGLEEASRSMRLRTRRAGGDPRGRPGPYGRHGRRHRWRSGGHRLRPARRRRTGPGRRRRCRARRWWRRRRPATRPAVRRCGPTTGRRPVQPPNTSSGSGTRPCTTSRSPPRPEPGARRHPAPRAGARLSRRRA